MAKYVILGNGVASVGCIEGIRAVDTAGDITVIAAERHPTYCRPLISYYLEGKTDLQKMEYRPASFYVENGVTTLYGKTAAAIDPTAKTVTLEDGETVAYDKLCVATGSSPFVPKFDGLETVKHSFTFMTEDDALALEAAVNETSRVLIVGAGLIGLKCAEGLARRAASITVCDLADRVLSSILDGECAHMVQTHLEENGIRFCLADSVARFDGNTAVLQSGAAVEFDVLVLAVGVRANIGLVRDAGGETNRGILVDTKMQTSLPDVYAVGDCTEGEDASIGAKRVLALLPNAVMQGRCAGTNMAGGDAVFDNAIPMNAIGFFGLHMMTAGVYDGEAYVEKTQTAYKKLFTKDGGLCGFILIGETARAGIYTSLIRNKIPLDTVDFEKLKKSATSMAFSPEKRKQMFGSGV